LNVRDAAGAAKGERRCIRQFRVSEAEAVQPPGKREGDERGQKLPRNFLAWGLEKFQMQTKPSHAAQAGCRVPGGSRFGVRCAGLGRGRSINLHYGRRSSSFPRRVAACVRLERGQAGAVTRGVARRGGSRGRRVLLLLLLLLLPGSTPSPTAASRRSRSSASVRSEAGGSRGENNTQTQNANTIGRRGRPSFQDLHQTSRMERSVHASTGGQLHNRPL